MDRPLKDVKLPKSGYIAKIVTYITRSESKSIRNKRYEGASVEFVDDQVHMKNIPIDHQERYDDEKVNQCVKSLVDKEGKSLDVNTETLNSLPNDDVNVLIIEINKVMAATEEKKTV